MPRKLTASKTHAATDFQKMIRAEAASLDMVVKCIDKKGERTTQRAGVGYCVCVTCGRVVHWKECDAGHFVAGRRASVLLQEVNCHPQCKHCNRPWPCLSGNPQAYHEYMMYRWGQEVIDYLKDRHNNESRHFSDDELIALRTEYRARTKAAERLIDGCAIND